MLDIKLIWENPEKIKAATIAKGFDGSVVDELIALDKKRRKAMFEVEELRAQRNKLTKDDIEQGKNLKTK